MRYPKTSLHCLVGYHIIITLYSLSLLSIWVHLGRFQRRHNCRNTSSFAILQLASLSKLQAAYYVMNVFNSHVYLYILYIYGIFFKFSPSQSQAHQLLAISKQTKNCCSHTLINIKDLMLFFSFKYFIDISQLNKIRINICWNNQFSGQHSSFHVIPYNRLGMGEGGGWGNRGLGFCVISMSSGLPDRPVLVGYSVRGVELGWIRGEGG